ncbi:MAG TPA: hypothetical protein VMF61_03275 [Candidatus Acidoferrales bacterium]|nr:hypothetical protein [Candidatus Acidoferrales bacterium]
MRFAFCSRTAAAALAIALVSWFSAAPARADLSMVVGPKTVVPNEPVSACSAKAKSALNAVLQNAFEAGDGTNQWLAYGQLDSSGHSSETAAIHCYPLDTGYVVTFTCAAQVPPNPQTADTLCKKLVDAFGAQASASLNAPVRTAGGAPWH